ncbi:MAG TPA: amidohydrolase [Vicinamibacterales bacterium]|nr:amidohydrolase [Vicinamibacterales bacterium]
MKTLLAVAALVAAVPAAAQPRVIPSPLAADIDARAAAVEQELLQWRRHLHEHPELSNREAETAKFVAGQLRSFGLEPKTGIARHGVVAVLQGALPGPVVALRSDMDGLPVVEETGLPFASRAKGEFDGKPVGVMHACGHDAHMSMLLATAKILTELRPRLRGTVRFIFQPAEEGAPRGESPAGADAMVKEGVLKGPDVDAIFGLHVFANIPSGHVAWRSGPLLAATDTYEIIVRGRQTHGANPWAGIDPIVVGSQIVLGLQTIVSRQIDITAQPAIVTVGQFEAGTRQNIIPDTARLVGTIRTFDDGMQNDVHARITRTAQRIAEAAGATAEVRIDRGYPVTVNNPQLTSRMMPTLERVAGRRLIEIPKNTVAEDFSYFQREVPGLFLLLGITPVDQVGKAAANHSPRFFVDETALVTGVRTLAHLAADYLFAGAEVSRK